MKFIFDMPDKKQARLNYARNASFIFVFICGFLLPEDWRQSFGVFAKPAIIASYIFPVIDKTAAISSIPEFVRGFMGFTVYIPFIYVSYFIYEGLFVYNEKEEVVIIVNDKLLLISLKQMICYLLFFLLIIFIFYFLFPCLDKETLEKSNYWRNSLVMEVVNDYFLIALCGAAVTVMISTFLMYSIQLVIAIWYDIKY